MMKYPIDLLKRAHDQCLMIDDDLDQVDRIGCFYCGQINDPKDVDEYLGEAAACPSCGIDAVLAPSDDYPLTGSFLTAMYIYWFD